MSERGLQLDGGFVQRRLIEEGQLVVGGVEVRDGAQHDIDLIARQPLLHSSTLYRKEPNG